MTSLIPRLLWNVNMCLNGSHGHVSTVADLEFGKGGFQYPIKTRVARLLEGFGGMPPPQFLTF